MRTQLICPTKVAVWWGNSFSAKLSIFELSLSCLGTALNLLKRTFVLSVADKTKKKPNLIVHKGSDCNQIMCSRFVKSQHKEWPVISWLNYGMNYDPCVSPLRPSYGPSLSKISASTLMGQQYN